MVFVNYFVTIFDGEIDIPHILMKILINNANPVFGRFLSHRLLIAGNVVEKADDNQQLIEKVEQERYDLIVFVANRLGLSDFRPLRALSRWGKVVVLSASHDEQTVIEAYHNTGISMYMTFPVDPSRLIRKIRALC